MVESENRVIASRVTGSENRVISESVGIDGSLHIVMYKPGGTPYIIEMGPPVHEGIPHFIC